MFLERAVKVDIHILNCRSIIMDYLTRLDHYVNYVYYIKSRHQGIATLKVSCFFLFFSSYPQKETNSYDHSKKLSLFPVTEYIYENT